MEIEFHTIELSVYNSKQKEILTSHSTINIHPSITRRYSIQFKINLNCTQHFPAHSASCQPRTLVDMAIISSPARNHTRLSASLIDLQRCPFSLAESLIETPGTIFSTANRRYAVVGLFGALGSLIIFVLDFCLYFFARRRRLLFSSLISAGDIFEMALSYSCFLEALTADARVRQDYYQYVFVGWTSFSVSERAFHWDTAFWRRRVALGPLADFN